jgi:hypothetical protein
MSDALRLELVLADLRRKYAEDQPREKYDDSEPRDDAGRWTADGGGAGSGSGGSSDRLVADNLGWDERLAWARDNFKQDEVLKKLDALGEEVRYRVGDYCGSGFEHINSALRNQGGTGTDVWGEALTAADKADIKIVDNAIAQSTIPQDMTLFRGYRGDVDVAQMFEPGKTLTDPAFMSTSLDHVAADSFSGVESGNGGVVQIDVQRGMNGLYISDEIASNDGEFEVLLPRNTSITVDAVDSDGTVHAHVV